PRRGHRRRRARLRGGHPGRARRPRPRPHRPGGRPPAGHRDRGRPHRRHGGRPRRGDGHPPRAAGARRKIRRTVARPAPPGTGRNRRKAVIRAFLSAMGPRHGGPIRAGILLSTAVSAVQGLVFALMVPALAALLGPDPAGAPPWTALLLAATAGYAVLRTAGLYLNFRVGGTISRALHHRIGDRLVRLPLGWFTGGRVGELNRIATDGVSRATAVPVHVYPPLADAVVTPVVAVLALFWWDWRIALAGAACLPLLWLVFARSNDAVGRNDAARDAAVDEASDRVLEYARAQPVLRAFGRTAEGGRSLDAALAAEHAAARRLLLRAVPALLGYSFAVRLMFGLLLACTAYLALGGALGAPEAVALLVLV